MRVIIVGCGRLGSQLAKRLDHPDNDLTVLDWSIDSFRRLGDTFGGTMVVGNGVDIDVLERAGIRTTDAFIAVTDGDNRNIMAAQIAQKVCHVPHVVCRIYDPIREEFYRTTLHIHTYCSTTVGADRIATDLESIPKEVLA